MATTVTWEALRQLASFRAAKGCALSLYLNLDPHVVPTPAEVDARVNSLLDEAAKRVEARRGELTHDQRVAVRADLDRIRGYIERDFQRDGTLGLAVFAAGLDNFWRALPLTVPVPDQIKINEDLYLAPLVPVVGQGDGFLVAVVGRERGDLHRLRGGRLEELADRAEPQPRRHDQGGWAQARLQRHVDELAQAHLRRMAEELERRLRGDRSARAVVVTWGDTRTAFSELLSPDVSAAVVGWAQAEAHVMGGELLALVEPVIRQWRAGEESRLLERWREEAGRGGRAATGWAEALEAASDGRVELLLYEQGVERQAWRCPACGRLALAEGKCPLDGTALEAREEGIDLALHQTLAHGGRVWAVEQSGELPAEGIGALLRY